MVTTILAVPSASLLTWHISTASIAIRVKIGLFMATNPVWAVLRGRPSSAETVIERK